MYISVGLHRRDLTLLVITGRVRCSAGENTTVSATASYSHNDEHYKKKSTEVHGKDEKHDHEDDHKYRSDADRHVGDHDKDGRHARNRDGKTKQEEGSDCATKWKKGPNPYKPAADVKHQTPAKPVLLLLLHLPLLS
ncbi:hypothetical protein Mp_5g07270 [Marchantia polymorpha subsp. ruderalis]|uniref:Uncharacterized protein n=1 Tax=Marchantia polymorpha subsp. ruderalis TaxID=1480154 RepID=A0AAF6BFV3_MARPO|nr:hypothetical protein Mp_5g07270 [Marchantia polymorpha subsp. ruderalis]